MGLISRVSSRTYRFLTMDKLVSAHEEKLLNLKIQLTKATDEEACIKKELEKYPTTNNDSILTAKVRHELVAPPNALYHDEVICAFLFCPICATIDGGEFSSMSEARNHVKSDICHH